MAACEAEAEADRVLHLASEPGTDLVLFDGLLTHIVVKAAEWIALPKAGCLAAPWRGRAAPGEAAEKAKFPSLFDNGRANVVRQSACMDRDNDFVMGRMPFPVLEMDPDDMKELGVAAGDLVEVYDDAGATQAMVCPTPSTRRKQPFMLFGLPTGGRRQRRRPRRRPRRAG